MGTRDGILSIRRQTTIPKVISGRNVLAIIEVGGKLFSKDRVYQRIWELGISELEKELISEMLKVGKTEKDYDKLYQRAVKEVQTNG